MTVSNTIKLAPEKVDAIEKMAAANSSYSITELISEMVSFWLPDSSTLALEKFNCHKFKECLLQQIGYNQDQIKEIFGVVVFSKFVQELIELVAKNESGYVWIDDDIGFTVNLDFTSQVGEDSGTKMSFVEFKIIEKIKGENPEIETLMNIIILPNLSFSVNILPSENSKKSGHEKLSIFFSFLVNFFAEHSCLKIESILDYDKCVLKDSAEIKCPLKDCQLPMEKQLKLHHVAKDGKTWYESMGAVIVGTEEEKQAYNQAKHYITNLKVNELVKGYGELKKTKESDEAGAVIEWCQKETGIKKEEMTLHDIATLFNKNRGAIKVNEKVHQLYHFYMDTLLSPSSDFNTLKIFNEYYNHRIKVIESDLITMKLSTYMTHMLSKTTSSKL